MFAFWTEKSPITQDYDFGNGVHVFPAETCRFQRKLPGKITETCWMMKAVLALGNTWIFW